MLKINSYYRPYTKDNPLGAELKNGDIVFCRGVEGTGSFYGIYVNGIGIIELENGSTAYMPSKKALHLKEKISYWTIEKRFNNVELVIKEDILGGDVDDE
jgi:hypothetical protein